MKTSRFLKIDVLIFTSLFILVLVVSFFNSTASWKIRSSLFYKPYRKSALKSYVGSLPSVSFHKHFIPFYRLNRMEKRERIDTFFFQKVEEKIGSYFDVLLSYVESIGFHEYFPNIYYLYFVCTSFIVFLSFLLHSISFISVQMKKNIFHFFMILLGFYVLISESFWGSKFQNQNDMVIFGSLFTILSSLLVLQHLCSFLSSKLQLLFQIVLVFYGIICVTTIKLYLPMAINHRATFIQSFLFICLVGLNEEEEEEGKKKKKKQRNLISLFGYVFFFPSVIMCTYHPSYYFKMVSNILDSHRPFILFDSSRKIKILKSIVKYFIIFIVFYYAIEYIFAPWYDTCLTIIESAGSPLIREKYRPPIYKTILSQYDIAFFFRYSHYWNKHLLGICSLILGIPEEAVEYVNMYFVDFQFSFYRTMTQYDKIFHHFVYACFYVPIKQVVQSKMFAQVLISLLAVMFHDASSLNLFFYWGTWMMCVELDREFYRKGIHWMSTDGYTTLPKNAPKWKKILYFTYCMILREIKVNIMNHIHTAYLVHYYLGKLKFDLWLYYGKHFYCIPLLIVLFVFLYMKIFVPPKQEKKTEQKQKQETTTEKEKTE